MKAPLISAPALAVLLLVAVPLVACSSGSGGHPPTSSPTGAVLPGGEGETSTSAATTAPHDPSVHCCAYNIRRARPLPQAKAPAKVREVKKDCPYISNQNEAIAEGKAVGRSTQLTTKPVGCKFYLAYPDYHVVTEITVKTYPTEITAFNTVARTGGSTAESTPGIGDGAVLYRTSVLQARRQPGLVVHLRQGQDGRDHPHRRTALLGRRAKRRRGHRRQVLAPPVRGDQPSRWPGAASGSALGRGAAERGVGRTVRCVGQRGGVGERGVRERRCRAAVSATAALSVGAVSTVSSAGSAGTAAGTGRIFGGRDAPVLGAPLGRNARNAATPPATNAARRASLTSLPPRLLRAGLRPTARWPRSLRSASALTA